MKNLQYTLSEQFHNLIKKNVERGLAHKYITTNLPVLVQALHIKCDGVSLVLWTKISYVITLDPSFVYFAHFDPLKNHYAKLDQIWI